MNINDTISGTRLGTVLRDAPYPVTGVTESVGFVPGTYIRTQSANLAPVGGGVSRGPITPTIPTSTREQVRVNTGLEFFQPGPYLASNNTGVLPSAQEKAVEEMGEFRKGLNRGWQISQATLYGGLGALADAAETPSVAQWGYEGYQRNMEEAAAFPAATGRMSEITGVGSALDWATGTMGELVPTVLISLAGGGIGGAIGKTVAGAAIKKAATRGIEDLVAAGVERAIATRIIEQQLVKQFVRRGATAGLVGSTTVLESGGNWGQDVESHGMAGTSPWMDLGFGFASGLSEAILGAEGSLLRSVLGKPVSEVAERTFRSTLASTILKSSSQEAFQEGFQEALSKVNANLQDHNIALTSEDLTDILDAAAAGALGGVGFGGAEAVSKYRSRNRGERADTGTATPELVNKSAIVQEQYTVENPYLNAVREREQLLQEEEARVAQATTTIDNSWAEQMNKAQQSLASIDAQVAEIMDVRNPKYAALDTSSRQRRVTEGQKKKAQVLAQVARMKENRDAAIEVEAESLRSLARKAGNRVLSAQEKQSAINQRTLQQTFTNDPEIVNNLVELSTDAETFANRQGEIIDRRIQKINEAKSSLDNALSQVLDRARVTGEAVPKNILDYSAQREQYLNNKLQEALNKKEKIRTLTTDLIKNITTATDATLGQIHIDTQRLYALADTTEGSLASADLPLQGEILATQVYRKGLNSLNKRIKLARDSLGKENVRNDPSVYTADSLLSNASKQLQSEILAPVNASVGSAEFAEQQAAMNRRAREEQAVERELHKDLQSAEQRRREEAARQAQWEAEQLGRGGSMGAEAAALAKTNADLASLQDRLSNMEQAYIAGQSAQRVDDNQALQEERQTQAQQAQEALQAEQLAEQTRVAEQAQRIKEEQGADIVENSTLTPAQQQVAAWISNTLKRLPGLRDYTIVASGHNDTRIPVVLQNAIFNATRNTNQDIAACYFNGRVYLFADRLGSKAQAVRAMIHEGIVHFGLRSIMTDVQRGYFLTSVFDSFKATPEWRQFAQAHPEYFEGTFDKFKQAEEFVAWVAEGRQLSQIMNRSPLHVAIQKFRAFLKKILKSLGLVRVTEDDLLDVISSSAHYLQNSDADGWYVNQNPSVLSVNGEEAVAPKATPNDIAWGLYFNSLEEANAYNAKVELSVSGVPGRAYSFYPVTAENTLNLQAPLSEQSQLVQEIVDSMLSSEEDIKVVPNQETGQFDAYLLNKQIGSFSSEIEANKYLRSDDAKSQVTGKDIYDYFAVQRNQKDTSHAFRQSGIRGCTYISDREPVYILFTGDDLSVDPYSPDTTYEQPMYMLTKRNSVELESGLREFIGTEKDNTFIANVYQKYHDQHVWLKRLKSFRTVRDATNPDGTLKAHNASEWFIEWYTDSYRRVQVVQRYLKEKFGPTVINSVTNVYKNLTGLTNKISYAQTELWRMFAVPLLEDIKKIQLPGIPKDLKGYEEYVLAAVDDYLYARHAPERNAAINAKIAPRKYVNENGELTRRYSLTDPSGMSNEKAAEIVAKYENVLGFREVAERIDEINRVRLSLLLTNNLISKADHDAMLSTYSYYVPLKNWNDFVADIAPGYLPNKSRSGISVGGRKIIREAKGRSELPQSPTINSILQLLDTQAIIMKNDVSRGLLALVKAAPDKDLWEISKPTKGEDGSYFRIQKGQDGRLHFHKRSHTLEGEGHKMVNVIDEQGKFVHIAIKDEALAKALRSENLSTTGPIVDSLRTLTRAMSVLQTARSPNFIFTNPIRDIETAILNLGTVIAENEQRGLIDKKASIVKGITKDVFDKKITSFLYNIIRGKSLGKLEANQPELMLEFQDFSRLGGRTRMLGIGNFEATYKKVRKELRTPGGFVQLGQDVFDLLDSLSDVSENLVRFSVYRNVLKAFEANIKNRVSSGEIPSSQMADEILLAKQKSANIALEITVNFTRKGAGAGIFNAVWAFSSASIQGSKRIINNLWRRGDSPAKNFARISKYMAVAALGATAQGMLCRMWMGDDDDGVNKYDKIPDYVKYSHIIIPFWDGGYIKIPLGYGYNAFWTLGVNVDKILHGTTTPIHAATDVVKESFSNFSPIDPTDEGWTAFVPTVLRPIAQISSNTKFSGAPIRPESTAKQIPDSQKYWSKTPEAYKFLATWLNTMFGGNPHESNLIDVSPTTLDHIMSSYLGGLYRFTVDTLGLAVSPLTGSDIDVSRLPIAGRFIGNVSESNTAAIYNQIAGKLEIAQNSLRAAKDENLSPQEQFALQRRFSAEVSLDRVYKATQRELSDIRKQEQALARTYPSKGFSRNYNERTEVLKKRRDVVMKRLVRAADRAGIPLAE